MGSCGEFSYVEQLRDGQSNASIFFSNKTYADLGLSNMQRNRSFIHLLLYFLGFRLTISGPDSGDTGSEMDGRGRGREKFGGGLDIAEVTLTVNPVPRFIPETDEMVA